VARRRGSLTVSASCNGVTVHTRRVLLPGLPSSTSPAVPHSFPAFTVHQALSDGAMQISQMQEAGAGSKKDLADKAKSAKAASASEAEKKKLLSALQTEVRLHAPCLTYIRVALRLAITLALRWHYVGTHVGAHSLNTAVEMGCPVQSACHR